VRSVLVDRWGRPTLRDALALAALLPWSIWVTVRLLGLEPGAPLIGALALTPLVAATAWLPFLLALALRSWAVAALAALVAVALSAAVLPRAFGGPQAPLAGGRSLSVMTANLRYGHGNPDAVMRLVRRQDVDVLSLQELTPAAARRLDRAGARARFPYRVLDPRSGASGSGLFSRLPLRDAARPPGTPHAMPQAQLIVAGVGSVLVKAVHTIPPLGGDVPAWREELCSLPHATSNGELRLLIGDFNATLDHHELRALIASGYRDAADTAGIGLHGTYRVGHRLPFRIAIDHVLVDQRAHVTAASVEPLPGSDHRALLTTLSLPASVPTYRDKSPGLGKRVALRRSIP
jgi:endonuclease/exonuclease/phosphatase (EEP) superfamily protein YafD